MAEEQNRTFQDKFMLRFPEGMRDDLKASAANMSRSMNAEIIQRLKESLEDEERDYLKLLLPPETQNALSIDALVHNVSFEERASQVLQAAYDQSSEYTFSLLKVDELARESTFWQGEAERFSETQHVDFLMYYAKVVQLSQFISTVIAAGSSIPAEILTQAQTLQRLASTEIETLQKRVEQIERDKQDTERFDEKYRKLNAEISDNEVGESDNNTQGGD